LQWAQRSRRRSQHRVRSTTENAYTDRAILNLKLQRDKLQQYSKRIQTVLSREKELAREALAKGEKQRALLILRRRKYQEQVLVKADQQLETLEQLVFIPHPIHWTPANPDSIYRVCFGREGCRFRTTTGSNCAQGDQ